MDPLASTQTPLLRHLRQIQSLDEMHQLQEYKVRNIILSHYFFLMHMEHVCFFFQFLYILPNGIHFVALHLQDFVGEDTTAAGCTGSWRTSAAVAATSVVLSCAVVILNKMKRFERCLRFFCACLILCICVHLCPPLVTSPLSRNSPDVPARVTFTQRSVL